MILRREMVTVLASDVPRPRAFYASIGFSVEHDIRLDEHRRLIELLPPGLPCSIALTKRYVDAEPGSLSGVQEAGSDQSATGSATTTARGHHLRAGRARRADRLTGPVRRRARPAIAT